MRPQFETKLNAEAGVRTADRATVDAAIRRAHRLRAEAVADYARAAARALGDWMARLRRSLRDARRRRADIHAMMTLDDRLLADIGLKRSDIKAAVYNGAPLRGARPEQVHQPAQIHRLATRQPEPSASERDLDRAA
jgi:uncharacterized protein YjiS (DUF1127 family)